jgi:hypothetical protein
MNIYPVRVAGIVLSIFVLAVFLYWTYDYARRRLRR